MAIYHFSVKIVSRAKGQSAVAKAAYNSRQSMKDERTSETHDYRRKGGIVFSGVFAPKDAPEWVQDRETLYNEIERIEKRKDAQLLREVEIALPHELSELQREWLVKDFVREQFVREGMLADVSIHVPDREGDQRNHHAHILLTMRELGPEGFGEKARDWNSREQLEEWRDAWERTANRYLEKHGHEARIDKRTLEAQGIDRVPTTHRGPNVDAMEHDGIATERSSEWRETKEENSLLAQLRDELAFVENQIRVTELESYLDVVDHDQALWDNALHDAAIATERKESEYEVTTSRDSYQLKEEAHEPSVDISDALQGVERLTSKVLNLVADAVDEIADGVSVVFETLLGEAPTASKPRPCAPEPKPDLRRYLMDEDYRRAMVQREIAERQQQERDCYKKQNELGR